LLETLNGDRTTHDLQSSIDQVQSWLSEAITITRNLSVDISPSVLHGDGITEAIHWLAARMKEQHGLQLEIEAEEDFQHLPDHMRVTLFQAVRELLFNVVKHAAILHANITMEQFDGRGRIIIRDAGKGFDVKAIMADPQASHGLLIIRDRLNLMDSTIEVESVPGNGTRVTIEFPSERRTT
jgi:two-component system CheB/CheR fusion protein